MFRAEFRRFWCMPVRSSLLLLACSHASLVVMAQSPAELRTLVFHPAPLSEPAAVTPAGMYDSFGEKRVFIEEERVDMARFEEVNTDRYLGELEPLDNYDPELAETILSVALLYQQQGKHEEALASLARAAGASRIQHGPWSEEQIRLAEHAIVSLAALQRHAELAEKHAALLELHQRVHGPDAPATAHAMLRTAQWQLGTLDAAAMQADQTLFNSTQSLFVDAIRILVEREAWTDPAIFELEQGLIHSYYLDACGKQLMYKTGSCQANEQSSRARMHSRASHFALSSQYSDGKHAYLRMIGYLKKDPEATVAAISDVMSGLADWHLLFGQFDAAADQYQQLAKLLSLTGIPAAEADALMWPRMPLALPAFMPLPLASHAQPPGIALDGYIDVGFEISRSGMVSKLDVLGTSPGASDAVVAHLVEVLRNSRFRPGSGAEATSGIRYYFSR